MSKKKEEYFEEYPSWIVFFSNLVSIAIYFIGAFIISKTGLIWLALYLIFIVFLEFKLIKGHCVDCYYVRNAHISEHSKNLSDFFSYDKTCAFGKNRICLLFFKKGNSNKFCKKQITWKDIMPDFIVSLVPVAVGIMLLIKDFNWALLSLVIMLLVLAFIGNSIVRSKLACKYCKQRQIGCPALELFESKRK